MAALLCLSPGATAARGAAYPSYGANTANTLVVGGAGTTITFAPKNPLPYTFFEITGGMKSSDRSTFKTEVTLEGVGTLTVLKDPGGSDRTGWVVLEYRAGAGSSSATAYSDTVYLVQPAEVCVDPKMGSKGADFFVAFMQNAEYTNGMSLNLYATADSATTYTVYSYDKSQQIASGNLDEKVVVNIFTEKAANTQAATYDNLISYNRNAEAVYKKSLLVHAEKPISLYAYNAEDRTSDASHIIPLKALGNEYFTASFFGNSGSSSFTATSESFLIAATEDQTLATITPTGTTDGNNPGPANSADDRPAKIPFTVKLNKGETYLVKSKEMKRTTASTTTHSTESLTGTHIKSTKPIAVFGGHPRASVACPNGYNNRDHLYEQMLPLRSWGKRYALVAPSSIRGCLYRIVAAYDNTSITITNRNGLAEALTLNRGDYAERITHAKLSEFVYIEANQPVGVVLIAESPPCISPSPGIGDPFMITISPADAGTSDVIFTPVQLKSENPSGGYFVAVIVETLYAKETKLTLCGSGNIKNDYPLTFTEMPNTPYSYAEQALVYNANRNYHLSNPYGFTAYTYGFGGAESTGFMLGGQYGTKDEEKPLNIEYCVGETPQPLPTCEGGLDPCPAEKRYFWYSSLLDWDENKALNLPPTFSTDRDTSFYFYRSRKIDCGISYPQRVVVSVLPRPDVSFANDTVCLSALPATGYDYGGRPTGGSYTFAEGAKKGQPFTHMAAGEGVHKVRYTVWGDNGCPSWAEAAITVETLDRDPFISVVVGDASLCNGDRVILEVSNAKGRAFQWYHADTLIAGSTGASYTVAPGASVYAGGKYAAHVYNSNGCKTVVDTTIIMYPKPDKPHIATWSSTAACVGTSYTLYDDNYVYVGSTDRYQWYKTSLDPANKIANATEYSHTVVNDTIYGTRHFVLGAVNPIPGRSLDKGCWSYDEFDITVYPSANTPHILPSDKLQAICQYDSLRLTATSLNEDGYTYKWYSKNQDLSISPLPLSGSEIYVKEGTYYVESISKHGCKSKSKSEMVKVETRDNPGKPRINVGPTVCAGSTIPITAEAIEPAAGATSYQWYAVGTGGTYTAIDRATGSTYHVAASGRYAVLAKTLHDKVTCASPYSDIQTVALWPRPLAPVVAGNTDVCVGNDNVLLAAAPAPNSSPVAKYQWYKEATQITNAIGDTLRSSQADTAASYKVMAISKEGCSSTFSTPTKVTAYNPSVAILGAAAIDSCFGKVVTLSTKTTNTNNTVLGSRYEWYKDNSLVPGYSQPSYVVSGSSSGTQIATYHLRVTDKWGCQSAPSNKVTVSIYMTSSNLGISSAGACAGDTLLLTATVPDAKRYDWFFEKSGTRTPKGWTTVNRLPIASATTSDAGQYVVQIENSNGCISEGRGAATVHASPQKPDITPDARHVCSGDSVRLLADSPTERPVYEWSFTGSSGKVTLPAAANRFYAKQAGDYAVRVKSLVGCWSAASSPVAIATYRKPERPTIAPADEPIRVCVSTATTITAASTGATSWQWYAVDPNNSYTAISGATYPTYAVTESGRYAVRAYIRYSAADNLLCMSDSVSIPKAAEIFPLPPAPAITGSASACAGDTVILRATRDPGGPVIASYRWYKNGVPTYYTSSDTCFVTQIEDASYTVEAISSKACTSAVSIPQKVSIRRPVVSIVDTISGKSFCHGSTVTLTSTTNTGPNSKYEWYKNDALIPNANAQSYVVRSEGSPTTSNVAAYHLYVIDEGGCRSASPSKKVTVSIRELPPAPKILNPPPVCEGSGVTLSASPSGAGSYQWFAEKNGNLQPIGVASNDTSCRIANIPATAAGRYAVKITNEWGCSSTGRGEVVVYAAPQNPILNFDDTVHLCTGDSVLLTAYTADGRSYEWYFDAGRLPNASADRIYAKMVGAYSAWSVNEHGCKSHGSDAVAVAVHQRPPKPAIAPDGRISVCANGSTTIFASAAGATNYQWYAVDPASAVNTLISGATNSRYEVTQSGLYAVRADILHGPSSYQLTCASVSAPKEVELFPQLLPPVVTGQTDLLTGGEKTSGCDGDILTLTAAVPGSVSVASYKWYKNGVEQPSAITSTYTVTQVEAAQYSVEAISDKGCRSEASAGKEVVIRRRPTVTIADGAREACGGTITLAAVTNPAALSGTYEWYENNVLKPGASTSPLYTVQGSGTATVGKTATCFLFVTDRYGCRSAASSSPVTVNIRELPPNPTAAAQPANGVCEGSNALLRVSPAGAGLYTWYKRNGRAFDSITVTADTSFRILGAQTADAGQYAVEITNTHGCKSALRGETELNVLGLPIVNIIETRACEDWTAEHTAGFAEPEGGKFSGWGCTTDGKFVPADVHQGEAVVTYSYTGPNGCANRDTKTIQIIRLPNTPIVSAAGPTAVCEDSVTVTLKANVAVIPGYEYAASYTYQWRKDGAALPGEDSAAYVAIKEGAYDVRVCNQGLCWALNPSAPVAVSVIPKPAPPVIDSKIPLFCPGESTELFVDLEQSETGSYQWYEGDSKEMRKIPGEIAAVHNADKIGQYAVKLFGERGCWSKLSNLITVGEHPLPAPPEIAPSQPTLFAGMDYALTVKNPQPGVAYEWYKNNLSIGLSATAFPIYSLNGDDTGRYSVKAINEHGCHTWSNAYALAWSESQLFIPNIFTPNSDGVNDYFQILGLEAFAENKLDILNKRGVVIFSQKNYQNTWSGEGLPNDIYYYLLELKREDGTTSLLRGYVHLRQ